MQKSRGVHVPSHTKHKEEKHTRGIYRFYFVYCVCLRTHTFLSGRMNHADEHHIVTHTHKKTDYIQMEEEDKNTVQQTQKREEMRCEQILGLDRFI